MLIDLKIKHGAAGNGGVYIEQNREKDKRVNEIYIHPSEMPVLINELEKAIIIYRNRRKTEKVLYKWACEEVSTKEAKRITRSNGVDIDFRQKITDNVIIGYNAKTGREERFEV